jgi:anti-sigma regulatory factor (Ser/Thr protein kinase)
VLDEGSLLVLYSDGLIERRGELLKEGLDRLGRAAVEAAAEPIESVCDHLVAALGVDSSRADDVAVLAVRLEPVDATSFRRVFDAHPGELRGLRVAMRAWLAERHVPEPTRNALLLAVGEACANAIEHAYVGRAPREVTVEIRQHADLSVQVTVRDFGRYRSKSEVEGRGRGTAIMRELATEFSRDSGPGGTTVRFRMSVDEAPLLA